LHILREITHNKTCTCIKANNLRIKSAICQKSYFANIVSWKIFQWRSNKLLHTKLLKIYDKLNHIKLYICTYCHRLELNHDITEILLKVALNTITPNAGIKPMLMVIINTLARPGSILSCPLLFLDQVVFCPVHCSC
jgi:hypothetical protein